MLGLPIGGWLRFFGAGLAAGALLLLLPFKPMAYLAAFVMMASIGGLLLVAVYARLYARRSWLRLGVRWRRIVRARTRRAELHRVRSRVAHDPWPPEVLGGQEGGAP